MYFQDRPVFYFMLAVLVSLFTITSFQTPHKIPLQISGSSTNTVLADRAEISLIISSNGPKQSKVADEVRETADEILTLLRPLTIRPNRTSTADAGHQSVGSQFLPPIATLSVDTFSSHSYPRSSILGEKKGYTSSITITAEFRSPSASNRSVDYTSSPGSEFRHLALVLPSLAKQPHTKIDYLKQGFSSLSLIQLNSRVKLGLEFAELGFY